MTSGLSILLTDHNVRETLAITDRSYIIDQGRILRRRAPPKPTSSTTRSCARSTWARSSPCRSWRRKGGKNEDDDADDGSRLPAVNA